MMMTPLVLMYGPPLTAEPSWISFEALGKGLGVPSWSGTFGTPEAPQGLAQGQAQGLQLELGAAPPTLEC